jgi:hypothetical protein
MLVRLAEYAFIVSTTEEYLEHLIAVLEVRIEKLLTSMQKALILRSEEI